MKLSFNAGNLNKVTIKNPVLAGFLFILSGIIVFLCIYGFKPLIVNYTGWIMGRGDLTQHYLGWCFFRSDPWTLPLGYTRSFGYPIGINITFTDSIPLFALFFKLLNPILPAEFQYFGMWELLCFILQALIGGFLLRHVF